MKSRSDLTGVNLHRVHVLDAFLQHLEETSANHGETCTAEQETTAAADARDEGEGDIRALASGAVSTRPLAPPGDNVDRDVDVQREILRVLDWTFSGDRNLVDSCIQVLDNSRVVKVKARTSGRSVWLVQGSRGSSYLCLRNYCSCRSFLELVRRGFPQPILCKHLLAVRLAPALGVSRLEEVDDHRLADRIGDCSYG